MNNILSKKIPFCNSYIVWTDEGYGGQIDPDRGIVYLNHTNKEFNKKLKILCGLFKL